MNYIINPIIGVDTLLYCSCDLSKRESLQIREYHKKMMQRFELILVLFTEYAFLLIRRSDSEKGNIEQKLYIHLRPYMFSHLHVLILFKQRILLSIWKTKCNQFTTSYKQISHKFIHRKLLFYKSRKEMN